MPWVISDSGPLMTAVYSLQYYDDASLLPLALEWTVSSQAVVWCQDDFLGSPTRNATAHTPGPPRRRSSLESLLITLLCRCWWSRAHLDERLATVLNQITEGNLDPLA